MFRRVGSQVFDSIRYDSISGFRRVLLDALHGNKGGARAFAAPYGHSPPNAARPTWERYRVRRHPFQFVTHTGAATWVLGKPRRAADPLRGARRRKPKCLATGDPSARRAICVHSATAKLRNTHQSKRGLSECQKRVVKNLVN